MTVRLHDICDLKSDILHSASIRQLELWKERITSQIVGLQTVG